MKPSQSKQPRGPARTSLSELRRYFARLNSITTRQAYLQRLMSQDNNPLVLDEPEKKALAVRPVAFVLYDELLKLEDQLVHLYRRVLVNRYNSLRAAARSELTDWFDSDEDRQLRAQLGLIAGICGIGAWSVLRLADDRLEQLGQLAFDVL